jgi:hypothetical protein
MKQTPPENVRSARDEPAMFCLLFRDGDGPAFPLVRQPSEAQKF